MGYFTKAWAIASKDLVSELRSKERLYAMGMFSILVMVVISFCFEPGANYIEKVAPGMFWIALVFAFTLGLNKTFAAEKDQDCMQGLMLSPIDLSGLYLGKTIGNVIMSLVVAFITLPIFAVFFKVSIAACLPQLTGVIVLTTVGFVSLGTLVSAISVGVKHGEMILPLLLYPFEAPIIIAAVMTTTKLLKGSAWDDSAIWVYMLAVGAVIYLTVSIVLFEFLVEE